jgi:CHASE1-domain containing sensor protein
MTRRLVPVLLLTLTLGCPASVTEFAYQAVASTSRAALDIFITDATNAVLDRVEERDGDPD